ncbi:MAG: hypothetical protein IT233_02155 [Bacteroidia bacterium]|nr:hypothetical protein [Bacteroidia bacterium]
MKTTLLHLFVIMVYTMSAQTVTFKAGTGDKELDVQLNELNASAKLDMKAFKVEMNTSFNCGNQLIDELMVKMGGNPADVFMLLQIAQQMNKSHDAILASFNRHKGKGGWGAVAKEMGIKPGSPEFHALKNSAKGKNGKMKGKKANNDSKGGGGGNNGKGKGKK